MHSPEGCFRMVLSINVALQCLLVIAHAVKHLQYTSDKPSMLEAITEYISEIS